ncbi:Clp protease N-terminal domain-containing protein [Streptomyces sp. NPDC050560]|uniref:Clp protease N-terminal domain-containing protein n=1 Tax=Streptomyces sp. NPDC050560 TaxID=3365630 RepID=UPI003792CB16
MPQQPAEGAARPAGPEAGLSPALLSVVSGARRRAVRDGDRQIDTAHLLHSLLESDPEVPGLVADGTQVVRLLGYLVQRSIGYGLRWQTSVEDSGSVPAVADPGWSPAAATAMERAVEAAGRRGEPLAEGVDLLAALLGDPECRAVEVLERAGVSVPEVELRVAAHHAARER